MSAIRAAFEKWAASLNLEALSDGDRELLHAMRTVAMWEYARAYRKQAAVAAEGEQR